MFGLTLGATFKVAIDIAAQQEAKGITIVWKSIKLEARQALT